MRAGAAAEAAAARAGARNAIPGPLLDELRHIARELPETLRPVRIFLFGSRAEGTAVSRSDYDIGIEAARPIDARSMTDVRERLDSLPIIQKIDVVDFQRVTDDFREVALRHRIPIID